MDPKEFCRKLDDLIEKNEGDWRNFEVRIMEKFAKVIAIENIEQFLDVKLSIIDKYVENNWPRISIRTPLLPDSVSSVILAHGAALKMENYDEDAYSECIYGTAEYMARHGYSREQIIDFIASVSVV